MRIYVDEDSDFEITPEGHRQLLQILKARYYRMQHTMVREGEVKKHREKMILLHVQINELEALLEGN